MARQYLLGAAHYGETGIEEGSEILLHVPGGTISRQDRKAIFTARFDGDATGTGGTEPGVEEVQYVRESPFGDRCLRMGKESALIYRDLPRSYDNTSGTMLMWVAPDTQTVFVVPEQTLFYEKGRDGSTLMLSLFRHHLRATWSGRGGGNTNDKKSAMDAREWHLVGMSWGHPGPRRVTMFLDGCSWYSSKDDYRPASPAREIGFGTGTDRTASFEGLIDEVLITSPALTEEEVLALYRAGRDQRLPFPDMFLAARIDTSWQGDTLRFEFRPRNSSGTVFPSVYSRPVIPEPPHAELHLGLDGLTTTPFDLIGMEITYDCHDPGETEGFPRVRMWESPACKSLEEDRGRPRKRVVESCRNFQLDRVGAPMVRVFWNGGEGAYYRFDKNAANPPDRVDHVREFLDSTSVDFSRAIMLFAETAQSDEVTTDFDTTLIRYMLNRYGDRRPRYYEFINEMIYAEGWGTKGDRDDDLVWTWNDGYYHTGGRCWTHMIEDTLSWFFEEASKIDDGLKFGWFIDRQGGWNINGTPAGVMEEWRQDSILLANQTILEKTSFLSFHDYFPVSMGQGSSSLAEGLWRSVGTLGWAHAFLNPKTWHLFTKYVGHPEWELFLTEYNTGVKARDRAMPARAERLFDTWAGGWSNISNFILRHRAGYIDKACYFKAAYSYDPTPHATINYAGGREHRTVVEKTFGCYGSLMKDSTLTADSVWTYGFSSHKAAHDWGVTDMPVFDAISTITPDTDTVAILFVNRDWQNDLLLEIHLDAGLTVDPEVDRALFHHVAFGPSAMGAHDEPDTSLLESWGHGYYYPSRTKFDSTDVDFVCDTIPEFSNRMSVLLGRAAYGVLEFPVKRRE